MKELDPNRPVQLRDGRQVRNVCWDFLFSDGTTGIAAIVRDKDCDYQIPWDKDGRYYRSSNTMSESDLINVPEQIKGWVNIYDVAKHNTREEANKNAVSGRIACIYIDILGGEGLE